LVEFEEIQTIDQYLYKVVDELNHVKNITSNRSKGMSYPGVKDLPDGAYTIHEASDELLSFNVQTNNFKWTFYHRNNGFSKLGYITHKNDKAKTKYVL
jgi:hypothetical protein